MVVELKSCAGRGTWRVYEVLRAGLRVRPDLGGGMSSYGALSTDGTTAPMPYIIPQLGSPPVIDKVAMNENKLLYLI